MLDCEFERINTIKEKDTLICELKRAQTYSEELLATHARTDVDMTEEDIQHDLNIMDDDGWE